MFVKHVLLRDLQTYRNLKGNISNDLRGWNYAKAPVKPPVIDVKVSVSEIGRAHV